jgi:hypothetical protein
MNIYPFFERAPKPHHQFAARQAVAPGRNEWWCTIQSCSSDLLHYNGPPLYKSLGFRTFCFMNWAVHLFWTCFTNPIRFTNPIFFSFMHASASRSSKRRQPFWGSSNRRSRLGLELELQKWSQLHRTHKKFKSHWNCRPTLSEQAMKRERAMS